MDIGVSKRGRPKTTEQTRRIQPQESMFNLWNQDRIALTQRGLLIANSPSFCTTKEPRPSLEMQMQ